MQICSSRDTVLMIMKDQKKFDLNVVFSLPTSQIYDCWFSESLNELILEEGSRKTDDEAIFMLLNDINDIKQKTN